MLAPSQQDDVAETRRVLVGLARGLFGAIAPERIADHILGLTMVDDWPLRRAALQALARRYRFAERDELQIAARPEEGALGLYRTRSALLDKRGAQRPYETALLSLEPLRTSCSCPDFVRSSLGLCKHGLVVLEALGRSAAKGAAGAAANPKRRARLTWDPEQPLRGPADRLARIAYVPGGRAAPPAGFVNGRPTAKLLADPKSRLRLIDGLTRLSRSAAVVTEPSLRTVLAEERVRAEQGLHGQALLRSAMSSLSGLSRKLYPYQREGVKRFFATGRLLLADDMGLGKTTQAIAACHGLLATQRVRRGLLIVPSALKPQWRREWQATTDAPITLVEGSPRERARCYGATKGGFLLIGYEQLLRDFAHVQRFAPEMVVLDEAQRIKNWATKSAAYVKALAPAHRLVLTGTPMENRFDELASIMDFVDDVALEPKWRLAPFHNVSAGEGRGGAAGVRHLDVLRERLSASMVRRVRKEVLAQLPARTDTRVPVEMTEVQRTAHEELRRPIAELAAKAARRPLAPAEFLRLMQLLTTQRMICNGMVQLRFDEAWPRCSPTAPTPALLEGLFTPKLAALRGLIEQVVLGQARKAVVFSQWRKMLRFAEWAIRDLLAAAGQRAVFFTGAESPAQREQALAEFHDDPAVTVMFLSDAGGVGLNLQRAASCCINLELPWNPAVLEQRIGRIYRLGQSLPVDIYNLVCEEGVESRIAQIVAQKSAVFSSLFDGTSDEVTFDGQHSFVRSVQKLVDPLEGPAVPEADSEADSDDDAVARGAEAASVAATSDTLPVARDAPSVAADGPRSVATIAGSASAPDVRATLEGLTISRLPDGAVRIEASAALAGPLAELLESLGQALRAQKTAAE